MPRHRGGWRVLARACRGHRGASYQATETRQAGRPALDGRGNLHQAPSAAGPMNGSGPGPGLVGAEMFSDKVVRTDSPDGWTTNGMANIRQRFSSQRTRTLFGLLLCGLLYIDMKTSSAPLSTAILPVQPEVYASEVGPYLARPETFEALIRRAPLRALEAARAYHLETVHDYTCTFLKQELLPGGMSREQTIGVWFRQEPFSVLMHWLKNPDRAERVIYVRGRWTDKDAEDENLRELAVCQPGPIARVFVKSVKQPIHSAISKQCSRRYIDEFGFARGLELLIRYCRIAEQRGELRLEFLGESQFEGRPTYVVERHLPYRGGAGEIYPDRVAVVHLDQAWRVPVSVRCFADEEQTQLLGRYEYSDVEMNIDLTSDVFDPARYGM